MQARWRAPGIQSQGPPFPLAWARAPFHSRKGTTPHLKKLFKNTCGPPKRPLKVRKCNSSPRLDIDRSSNPRPLQTRVNTSVLGATRPCCPACSPAKAGGARSPGTRCLNKGPPLPEWGPPQTARARSPRPSRRFPASARPLAAAPAPRLALPAPTLPPIINKHFCFAIKEQRWRIILARAALAYVSMDIHLKIKYMPPPSGAGGSAAGRGGAADSGAGGGCAVAAKAGAQKGAQPAGPHPRAN